MTRELTLYTDWVIVMIRSLSKFTIFVIFLVPTLWPIESQSQGKFEQSPQLRSFCSTLTMLSSNDPKKRARAIATIQFPPPSTHVGQFWDQVYRLRRDPSKKVKLALVGRMSRCASEGAKITLMGIASHDKDGGVREAAVLALDAWFERYFNSITRTLPIADNPYWDQLDDRGGASR